jgi:hypothetical protein
MRLLTTMRLTKARANVHWKRTARNGILALR